MSLQTIGRRDLKAENIGNFIVSHHISTSCCKDKTFFLTHTISPKLFKESSNNLYILYLSMTPVMSGTALGIDVMVDYKLKKGDYPH